jgi:hypothetical protein
MKKIKRHTQIFTFSNFFEFAQIDFPKLKTKTVLIVTIRPSLVKHK